MNIGIDIDNTITEIKEELDIAVHKYAIKLGKNIRNTEDIEDINNDGSAYIDKFQFTYEELKYFLKNIQEEITNRAKPRKNAVETIKKLRSDGHKIIIITARDNEFHDNPYLLSKNWLDKNNIEYDKIIVNAREKGTVCKNENVDLFIDDQLNNCLDVLTKGIKVIRISDEISKNKDIIDLKNWNEIYDYIGILTNK